jgi:hypothetical protein
VLLLLIAALWAFAVFFAVRAVLKKKAGPAVFAGGLFLFGLVALLESPWWVLLGVALVVIGIVLIMSAVRGGPLVIVAAAIVFLCGIFWWSPTTEGSASVNTPSDDMQKALTVTTVEYDCATDPHGLVGFDIKALKPVGDGGRKWSDAISTPFGATEPQPMLDEAMAEMCTSPHFGAMVGHFFANLRLGAFTVADVNPWLNEFKGDPVTVIHTRAATYIPLLDKQNPTTEEVATAATRNRDWQGVAERLNTLLKRFTLGKVQEEQSVLNYHLVAGGVATAKLPPVELNPRQEGLPALRLYLTEKGRAECLASIGLNTGDKRVEQFPCVLPPDFTPPGSSMTNPPGDCGSGCMTTTPPGGCKPGECVTTTTPPNGCPNCPTTTTGSPKDTQNKPTGTVGGGVRTTELGTTQPYTPPPVQHRTTEPAPPTNTGVPSGSVPTSIHTPTTEAPAPTGGQPPGDPGSL